MAITRAQQFKQMLQEGGRIGFRRGGRRGDTGQASYGQSTAASTSKKDDPSPQSTNREKGITLSQIQNKKRTKTIKDIKDEKADDRGNFLQNRNQQNVVSYARNLAEINANKNLSFIEKFNAKKRLKNKQFLDNRFTQKAQGIADYYGLSVGQLEDLLDAYDRDNFDLSDFRSIVDAGAPPSIISSDPNFLRAQELALSKGMAKGNKLSTGALFSTTDPTTRIDLPSPLLNKLQGDPNFSNLLSGLNRLKSLDKITSIPGGPTQKDVDNYFNLTMGKGGIDPITGNPVDALFTPIDDRGSSGENDPCKGPNPPAYCFIGKKADQTAQNAIARNLGGLSPRIGGSIFDFTGMAEGGIVDMAREEMFLGGIVKGIKKGLKGATRAIKKVAKSPFGKAALLAAPFLVSGGLPSFLKGDALKSFFLKDAAKGFALDNLTGKGVFAGIAGLSALAGLTAPKQDEDEFDLDAYYASSRLNPNPDIFPRILGSQFVQSAADGGRIGYAEAGGVISEKEMKKIAKSPLYKGFKKMYEIDPSMARDNDSYKEKLKIFEELYDKGFQKGGDVEPVAKKTMPLLDMGGQEMDLRAEGGFVPIGRMEKADDVPARLSKNEFVFTAEAVRNAGDGDVDKGAEVMYNMMKNLEDGGNVSDESQGLEGARRMFQTSKRLEEVL